MKKAPKPKTTSSGFRTPYTQAVKPSRSGGRRGGRSGRSR